MSIAIAAIFKNERDYLPEWFAWHLIAGFQRFYIADNESTDGTSQFLEAMAQLGYVRLFYQPTLKVRSQLRAYARIREAALGDVDSLLMIDADEFLVHESFVDGEEAKCLQALLNGDKVGSVSINWRTFGSSGHKQKHDELVLNRFTKCCEDHDYSNNCYLKTAVNIKATSFLDVHVAEVIPGHRRINAEGKDIDNYFYFNEDKTFACDSSSLTREVVSGPLRINHYVVKSLQEFCEKKNSRGSAMKGADYDRGINFFNQHDFKEANFVFPQSKIARLEDRICKLERELHNTSLFKKIRGCVDTSNADEISGWLADDSGNSEGLSANIFVNGVFSGTAKCGFFRKDLAEAGVSQTGFSGFRWTHPVPLSPGDSVQVRVNANCSKLQGLAQTTIE